MSLDALAPDQRAVVQLVLQQDRSYEDLAALLGITPEAVRERAHRGMERLAPGEAVDPADRAQISDYLLGQQSVSGRESTRALLTASQPARSWALAISSQLAGVARGALPEVPSGPTSTPERESAPEPEPVVPAPAIASDPAPAPEEPVTPTRARPRPRQRATETTPPADFGFGEAARTGTDTTDDAPSRGDGDAPRASRLGGALLIGGLAIFVAALVIFLVSRGGDDDPGAETTATGTTSTEEATPTASTEPEFTFVAALRLAPPEGGDQKGRIEVYADTQSGQVAFNVKASNLEPTAEDLAYGLWIVGGPENHFLGYAAPVEENGKLATSGPREQDAANFAQWLADEGARVLVTTETEEGATEPGPTVLQGDVADAVVPEDPAAQPTP